METNMNPNEIQVELTALRRELIEIKAIVLDNQHMTKSVFRKARFSTWISAIKWIVIVGVTLGAFYYIQPVIDALMKTYQSVGGIGSGPDGQSVLDLFKSL